MLALCFAVPQSALSSPAPTEQWPEQPTERAKAVEAIGYQLRLANAAHCPQTEAMVGWTLHDLAAYDQNIRPEIEQRFGLGLNLGVLAVFPHSNAQRAGLRDGDVISSIGSSSVSPMFGDLIRHHASAERNQMLERFMLERLRNGPIALTIERAGTLLSIKLTAEFGCSGAVSVVSDPRTPAWSSDREIAISLQLLALLDNADELAFVLAHEMGHIWLSQMHQRSSSSLPTWLLRIEALKIDREMRADLIAVEAVRAAGYRSEAAIGLLPRIGKAFPAGTAFMARTIATREHELEKEIGNNQKKLPPEP